MVSGGDCNQSYASSGNRPRYMLVPKHGKKKVEEHSGKAEAGEIVSDFVWSLLSKLRHRAKQRAKKMKH